MQLTDNEIREIIAYERAVKKKKQRKRRKRKLIFFSVIILFLAIGIFVNRNAFATPKGIIFIDPGHGGIDSGSYVGNRYEKNDTLNVSLELRDALKDLGYKVYMSRTDDRDLDREDRGELANEKNAQLFISIHRNKAEEGNGVELYIPSTDDRESRLLADNIMKALVSQGFTERTITAGTLVSSTDDYPENSVPMMPSCLVELGFLQNKQDNKLFDEKTTAIAKSMANAIDACFNELYPEEVEN